MLVKSQIASKSPNNPNQVSVIMVSDKRCSIQGVIICVSMCCVLCPMLSTDEMLTSVGNIKIVGYFHPIMMTGITINGPSNGDLINCVHLGTLKYIDNTLPLFRGPHKVLLEVRHGNGTSIFNTNINAISIKISLDSLASIVGCTSHASYVQQV